MAYEGEDWIKTRTWDLYAIDENGAPKLITDINTYCSFLQRMNGKSTDRERLTAALELPSSRPMPARLRREVDRFLASGRDNLPG